jgi:type I restriction enzyme, S subunit
MKKGWELKKLGEVCLIKPPKSEARSKLNKSDLVSFIPMEILGINQIYFNTTQTRPLDEVEGSYTYFADGDVLLAKITPCFENGKLGIAKNLKNGIGFGSSEYIVFRPNESLFNEYLYYYLAREQFRKEGSERMSGAVGHKRVAKEFIENYLIPLPPLSEQQSIVAKLDALSAETKKLESIYRKKLADLEELKKSILQKAFAGELTD